MAPQDPEAGEIIAGFLNLAKVLYIYSPSKPSVTEGP
jgi:hypothetical protein